MDFHSDLKVGSIDFAKISAVEFVSIICHENQRECCSCNESLARILYKVGGPLSLREDHSSIYGLQQMFERLDRALNNDLWRLLFPDACSG